MPNVTTGPNPINPGGIVLQVGSIDYRHSVEHCQRVVTNPSLFAMEDATEEIENLLFHNKNFEKHRFIPDATLYRVTNENWIRNAVSDSIEPCNIPGVVKDISERARKFFAILLLIRRGSDIVMIIRQDSLQNSILDSMLPCPSGTLEKLFHDSPKKDTAMKFFHQQWSLATPHFSHASVPRHLDDDIILPIMGKVFINKGSFGEVWRVKIHPERHTFNSQMDEVGYDNVHGQMAVDNTFSSSPLRFQMKSRQVSTQRTNAS